MRTYLLFILGILAIPLLAHGQSDTLKAKIEPYIFMDVYYVYNFHNPDGNTMPSFVYNHNRHNEFALNQAILGGRLNHNRYRAALGFHAGTYVTANYAGESQPLSRNIFEANIGYKLKDKLWLDAGIFSSYIGYETSISFDMWTLTRPIMAENYPYYQSGIKLSYEPTQKWFFSALVLNGWQNINETNNNKPLGVQIQYKPNSKILLNTSLFWGKEKAAVDSVTEIANRRSFFDFYGIFQLNKQWSTALYVDFGSQRITSIQKNANWYAITGMLRYKPIPKIALCLRGEHYQDESGVMVPTYTENGFTVSNTSLNIDYFLTDNILARIEGKTFLAKDKIFVRDNSTIGSQTYLLTTSLSIKF